MEKNKFISFLLAIATISYGSSLESLPHKSRPSQLEEYCSSFTNISLNDVFPFVEFIKLIPNTELQCAVATLKSDSEGDHFPTKSAFGLLQVLFPELQPKEKFSLLLTEIKSQDCGICYESKVDLFYEVCGFGLCKNCLQKIDARCPSCRKYHRFTYEVALYQIDKSHYPFVAVLPSPEKPDLNKSIKKVHSSLLAWTDLVNNQPFSEQSSIVAWVGNFIQKVNPFAKKGKLSIEQTKATIKILQIFDIFQHRSLWEFKQPLVILHSSVKMLLKMLYIADPNRVEMSFMSIKETVEIEVMQQTFSEMENSLLELLYYIQWLINTFIRQCYHVSDEPVTIEENYYEILENFEKEFEL